MTDVSHRVQSLQCHFLEITRGNTHLWVTCEEFLFFYFSPSFFLCVCVCACVCVCVCVCVRVRVRVRERNVIDKLLLLFLLDQLVSSYNFTSRTLTWKVQREG